MENENVIPEVTTPTEEQGAPATEETAENTVNTEESATQNDTTETTTSEEVSHGNDGTAEPEFALDVKYNKEIRTLNRDEAADYAQKGIFYETKGIEPLYNKLDYIAAQRGQTIEEVVDRLFAEDENNHRKELVDKFGEESGVIDDLMKIYREGQKQKYDKIVSDRKEAAEKAERDKRESLEARLASEFSELKAEFPELTDFSQLPKEVKADAANGRDLMSSYLRFRHKEEKRIAAAQKTEEAAAKSTTGTASTAEDTADSVDDAFIRGVLGKN